MLDIYGTLGPSCADADTLEKMFQGGMTGVRLNLSHSSLPEAAGKIEALHEAAGRCGIKAKLLVDLQGPELRIGKLAKPVELLPDSQIRLGEGGIPVPSIVRPYLNPGQQVLLDDGKILLEIAEQRTDGAIADIRRGGTLLERKSIALPGAAIYPETMTEMDRFNIGVAGQFGVTGVMQPFVRDSRDLKMVRAALNAAGAEKIRLFAKIENMDGVQHLDELIPECDEIVIARGDLGNAMPLWELPGVQKQIGNRCLAQKCPFMVVTQMLSSMEKHPVPTRAEVSDIFNAAYDGASSVMVTGETAVGEYPVEVIRYLARTAEEGFCFRMKQK